MPSEEKFMDTEAGNRRSEKAAQHGILILDAQTGVILDVDSLLANMMSYAPEGLLGKTLWEIGIPKEEEASQQSFQDQINKGYLSYDNLSLMTKDGRTIGIEVIGKVHQISGNKVVQCSIRGLSQRDEAELTEQRIRQTQKMEPIGQFAAGLAHDLNNLLGVILGYCAILEADAALPEASRKLIVEIHSAGTSAKSLAQRLLAFNRGQVVQRVDLDLNDIISNTEKMLRRMIGHDIELVSLLCEGVGRVHAAPSQLEQVLMNLTINARDAMPKGGRIVIETANAEIDETNAEQNPSLRPGRYVMLSVSDTGTGMDLDTQARIFEPFFTTKPFGRGTGLGLSTVLSIVEQSGGAIAVNSQPGAGATFKIHFPRSDRGQEAKRPVKAETVAKRAETILLVDDSASLRGLIRRNLEDSGYTVLDSGDPTAALCIAAEHDGPIALTITDVVLPGFSGTDLAERVNQIRPESKVLFVSGYNDVSIVPLDVPGRNHAFLSKPFTQDELLRKVRQLLDSSMDIPPSPAL